MQRAHRSRGDVERELAQLRDALERIADRVSDKRLAQDPDPDRWPRAVGAVEAIACHALGRPLPARIEP